MASQPFTVIGFPRSGTRYVAQLLQINGIPCSHEGYHPFDLAVPPPHTMNMVSGIVGDWNKAWRFEMPAVLITRNPKDIVKSYHVIIQAQRRIMEVWLDGATEFEELWRQFNLRVENTFKNIPRFKVETLEENWAAFVAALGYTGTPLMVNLPPDVNTGKKVPSYGKYELKGDFLFNVLRKKYGY